jgi:hypothetical protein
MGKERDRNKHRDDDDMQDPLAPDERSGVKPDTKHEARGGARENAGNTARDTAANPTGPEENDTQRRRDQGSE